VAKSNTFISMTHHWVDDGGNNEMSFRVKREISPWSLFCGLRDTEQDSSLGMTD
jgi:hypothetical protein